MFNPYQQYIQPQQIVKVNGINGANAYALLPNSSVLLLDESAPRLFLKTTDAAGYASISAYKLEPYVEEKAPDLNELTNRIKKLEELINGKSNIANAERKQSDATKNQRNKAVNDREES